MRKEPKDKIANIADYKSKHNTDTEEGSKKVKRSRRKHRIEKVYRAGLIIVVILALLVAYMIYERTKVYDEIVVKNSVSHTSFNGTTEAVFDGGLLSYSKNGASAIDGNGNLLWNQSFDMQNPLMSMCDNTVAFADYGGSTIYLQNSEGKAGSITTNMPIRKIAVSSNGYVAAVLEDVNLTWIYMYDFNGTEIAYVRSTMEKSGYPIDIDLSPDGELLAVSYYYVDCNDVKSSVAFYNFGPVGQNSIDNYVSGYNYANVLVPFVEFLDSKTAFSLSPERLAVYAGAHKPVSVSDLIINDEVLSVYYSNDAIAVIYKNDEFENRYRLELYDTEGKKLLSHLFDFDYSGVTFSNKSIILYGDTSVFFTTYEGELRYDGSFADAIKFVIPTRIPSEFVFVTENRMDTVEFK